MALIETIERELLPSERLPLFDACLALTVAEIEETERAIHRALWQVPANIELAKTLISKLFGLEIVLGTRKSPKLKPPITSMRAQGRDAGDATALLK